VNCSAAICVSHPKLSFLLQVIDFTQLHNLGGCVSVHFPDADFADYVAGSVICVGAPVVIVKARGENIGMNPLTLLAVVVFVTSFLGYFVTGFSTPRLSNWSTPLIIRIAWQLAGGYMLAIAVVIEGSAARWTWIFASVAIVIGFAMSYNAVVDLAQGPKLLHGNFDIVVHRTRHYRGGEWISADLLLIAPDGSTQTVNMVGWGATDALDKLKDCKTTDELELTVLMRLERVVDAHCKSMN